MKVIPLRVTATMKTNFKKPRIGPSREGRRNSPNRVVAVSRSLLLRALPYVLLLSLVSVLRAQHGQDPHRNISRHEEASRVFEAYKDKETTGPSAPALPVENFHTSGVIVPIIGKMPNPRDQAAGDKVENSSATSKDKIRVSVKR